MPTQKQIVVGVAAGLVIGGAVAYAVSRKKASVDDEPDFTAPAPTQKPEAVTAAPAVSVAEVSPTTASSAQMTREYSFRTTDFNEKMLEEALAEHEQQKAQRAPVADKADGSVQFAHLGVSLVPPAGWSVREEPSPMPNVAMICVTKPEFAEKQMNPEDMGSVPVIILSVEDISGENLDLLEFKEKSKQMALTQMMMMTNGMVQPHMKFDEALTVGPFRHCLEYGQALPPYFELSVCNVLAVEGGLAYVFQIMCSPKVMGTYKPIFMDIARTVKITAAKDVTIGHLDIKTTRVSVSAPPSWAWNTPKDNAAVLEFTTPSSVKSEQITLYESASAPATTPKSETVKDGVTICNVVEGRNHHKEYKYGGYTAVVKPLQKPQVHINDNQVIAMIKSATPSTTAEEAYTYVNKEHGYAFRVIKGCRIIATVVGGGTVVYAPLGIPDQNHAVEPEEQGPTVTIRVGTPETDPDCAGSLDGWNERMEIEAAGGNISNVQRGKRAGHECLIFQSKEMQEVGPGQRMEIMGKVFIFVRGNRTTLIRWESATGLWRKFESKMEQLIDSLQLL